VSILDFFRRPKPLPWLGRRPIEQFLKSWDGKTELPDDDAQERIKFVAGGMDGVFAHHGGDSKPTGTGARVAREVIRAAKRDDDRSKAALYEAAMREPAQAIADEVLSGIDGADRDSVAATARWLVRNAPDREPVKLGLFLLGASGTAGDLPLLELFARHEEFTKFAAFAAGALLEDPVDAWMRMAQRVHGWGKIDLVERIASRGAGRAEVREWLLRHGCSNFVMDEYLGHVCASAGRLHEAIAAEHVDDEMLQGMITIVLALTSESGAAADIRDYEFAEPVILHLIRHLEAHPSFASQRAAGTLLRWIDQTEGRGEEFRDVVRRRCRAIVDQLAPDELRARFYGSPQERWDAWRLAGIKGIDLWEDAFALLDASPYDSWLYQYVVASDDPMRQRRVIAFAEERLPLEQIASGPRDELGFGDDYLAHGALDMILQRMKDGDVFSERLVLAALRSPVTRNRNMALNAIEARQTVSRDVRAALAAAASIEPNAGTREQMGSLAQKFPL